MRTRLPQDVLIWLFGLVLFLLFSSAALAQNSRFEELAEKQAEKAKKLEPYTPNALEKWILRVQGWGLLRPPKGPYPAFTSAYPTGGLALGAGYRGYYGDTAYWDLHGAWSVANYRMLDGTIRLPDMASGVIKSRLNAHYVYANKVPYYGIGNDTVVDDQTKASYLYKPLKVDFAMGAQAGKHFLFGGNVAYEKYEIGNGVRPGFQPMDQLYNPETAPGLGVNPEYSVAGAFARFDWRESPGYTTSGGVYRIDWQDYHSRNEDNLDFRRTDVTVAQYIPILRANQIIVLRALGSFTQTSGTNEVPFYLLPRLGGGEELRGYPDFRFTDRNRLLLTAEYRWTPSKFLDMALFYETGKVAAEASGLDLHDLHDCYGFGIRLHGPTLTPLRLDIARSVEGTRFIVSGGTAF